MAKADGAVKQGLYYYPYGRVIEDEGTWPNYQPYKYGGKEEEPMHGVGLYDFHARWLSYRDVPYTLTMDPLCEKYYSWSPYSWCAGNPIRNVDMDGRRWRPAQSVRPMPGRFVNNVRYMNAYPNGVRPPSTTRVSSTGYHLKGSGNIEPFPNLIATFETPNGTKVQITPNNIAGQKLTLRTELAGVFIQEVKEKFRIQTLSGPVEKTNTNIRFSDMKMQAEFNSSQSSYDKQFNIRLTELNNASMSENNGKLNALDFISNTYKAMNEFGDSPKNQIKNWLNKNKDAFTRESSDDEFEQPEWREQHW
jgi:RHS repeat-associated protein